MFENAINKANEFTRPIHTLIRFYKSNIVQPTAATLFFVNDDGWALTCKHVFQNVLVAGGVNKKYREFAKKASKITKNHSLKALEKKYSYDESTVIEIANRFINCVNGKLDLEYKLHPTLDIALIKFKDFDKLLCSNFPVFPKDTSLLQQGKTLCRLGYPFAEYSNFEIDKSTDSLTWTTTGKDNSPKFPLDGMVTRLVGDTKNIIGFELSTPGIRGQSGGPVFDHDGIIWGIQSQTAHLDLDFDIDIEVLRKGKKKKVKESAFLHVGRCIHIEEVKSFMNSHSVSFQEA